MMQKKYLSITVLIFLGISTFSIEAMKKIDLPPNFYNISLQKERLELMKNGGYGIIPLEALQKIIKVMIPLIGPYEKGDFPDRYVWYSLPQVMAGVFCSFEIYPDKNQELLEKVVTSVIYSFWNEWPNDLNVYALSEAQTRVHNFVASLLINKGISNPDLLIMQRNISGLVGELKNFRNVLGFFSAKDAVQFFKKCLSGYYNKTVTNEINIILPSNVQNNPIVSNNQPANNNIPNPQLNVPNNIILPNNAPNNPVVSNNQPANNTIPNPQLNVPNNTDFNNNNEEEGSDYLWFVYPDPRLQ